jgi:hypothetical protein
MVVDSNKCKHKHHNATTLPELNITTQRHLFQEGEVTSVNVHSPPINGVWWLECKYEVDVEFTNYSCKLSKVIQLGRLYMLEQCFLYW